MESKKNHSEALYAPCLYASPPPPGDPSVKPGPLIFRKSLKTRLVKSRKDICSLDSLVTRDPPPWRDTRGTPHGGHSGDIPPPHRGQIYIVGTTEFRKHKQISGVKKNHSEALYSPCLYASPPPPPQGDTPSHAASLKTKSLKNLRKRKSLCKFFTKVFNIIGH